MSKISTTGKLTRDTTFIAARQPSGAGFRRDSAAPPPPSISDNHISRIIPVVLLAALSVLAVSAIIHEAPAAFADHYGDREVWSATLTVGTFGGGFGHGCTDFVSGSKCSSTSVLSDGTFTYGGVDYAVKSVAFLPGTTSFSFVLDKTFPGNIMSNGTLYVDGSPFRLAGIASGDSSEWLNAGLSWSVGDTVQLRLAVPPPTLTASISGNPVEGGEAVTLTLTLSEPVEEETSMQRRVGGTAAHYTDPAPWTPGDYHWVMIPTFPAGGTTATTQIRAVDDNLVEGCETIIWDMTVWPGTDQAIHLPYTVYIEDDDGGDGCPAVDPPPGVAIPESAQIPVITLAGSTNMTVPLNSVWVDPGYTATDADGNDITAGVTVTGTVDTTREGTYLLYYQVADSSGTPATPQIRSVNVVAPAPQYQAPEPVQEPQPEPQQEAEQEPKQDPEQEPAQEPTQEPEQEPAQEPEQEAEQEPAQEPTQEPEQEPAQEPEQDPEQEPAQEPTQEPEQEPAQEPKQDPEQEPAQEPAQEPEQEPEGTESGEQQTCDIPAIVRQYDSDGSCKIEQSEWLVAMADYTADPPQLTTPQIQQIAAHRG